MPESFVPLARKWRPRLLADMVGQAYVVRALQNAARQNRLHHAFMFTGTRGIGKTTLARIFAMLVNCESRPEDGAEPCLKCDSCQAIAAGRLTDVIELDAASHTGVDNMRELLEGAGYAPARAKFKVFIIDEAHMLSAGAFNAMLKILEEPPPHVKFILATTEPRKAPVTVRSRCLCFALLPLTREQIAGRLTDILNREEAAFQESAVAEIARLANGSLRDALSILDQALAHSDGELRADDARRITGDIGWELLGDVLRAVADHDATRIRELSARHVADNVDFDAALARLAAILHKTALFVAVPGAPPEDAAEAGIAAEMAKRLSAEDLQVLYEIALRGRQQLPFAPDAETGFEMALLRMMLFAPQAVTAAGDGAVLPTAPPPVAAPAESAPAAAPGTSPAPSSPAAESSPAEAATTKDWQKLIIHLSAVSQALARHCLAEEFTDAGVVLRLDKSHADKSETKKLWPFLEAELRQLRGAEFAVRLVAGEDNQATEIHRAEQIRAATDAPFIRALQEALPSARVVPETIRLRGAGEGAPT